LLHQEGRKMSNWNLDHTYPNGRLQKKVDCSWGYSELIKHLVVNPIGVYTGDSGIQGYYDMWEDRGLTEEVYEQHKTDAGCVGPQCSDPNTVWSADDCHLFNTKENTLLKSSCYCKCQTDYELKDGVCKKKSNISAQGDSEEPPFTPIQILGGVAVGITLLVTAAIFMTGGKKDVQPI